MPKSLVCLILCVAVGLTATAWAQTGNPLDGLADLKAGSSQRASSSDPNWQNGNGDARPIPPGATLVVADLTGPGMITHFWNTIADEERGYSRLLVLRMYWDGEEKPSVECPIGDFFGIGHGIDAAYSSLPTCVTCDGKARNCYWPMPFGKSAKITVTNEGRKPVHAFYYYIDWRKLPELAKHTAYFHAMYRQEFPTIMGRNYLLADIEGRGHYVGTLLSVRQLTASWWGEGDDFFFIDGELEPSLRGTGSEDYFCDAWGLRKMANLYYGAPVMEGMEAFSLTTAYRWHIVDPVIFTKSLRVEIEHKGVTFKPGGEMKSGFEERSDDFSSVAFWYQVEPHKAFPEMPKGHDRLYYDFANMIEAEKLIPAAKATAGAVEAQGGQMSGGAQLFWTPSEPNQSLTIPFEAKTAGVFTLLLALTHSWDYGVFEFDLDGKPLGAPIDLYHGSVITRDKVFGPVELAAGTHPLTVRNKDKNDKSKGYYFGLDGILLGK